MKSEQYPPPIHLSEAAKKIWRAVVPSTGKDEGRLAMVRVALESLDRADECRKRLAEEGFVVGGTGKMKHANPLIAVEKEARACFIKCWSILALHFDRTAYGLG